MADLDKIYNQLNDLRVLLVVFVCNIGLLQILFFIGELFVVETGGVEIFDLQNDLSVAMVESQLAQYSQESIRLYYAFFVVDAFFPFVGSMVFVVLSTIFLRRSSGEIATKLLKARLPFFALLATVADWAENISFVTVVLQLPEINPTLISIALVCKSIKLVMIPISGTIAVISLIVFIISKVTRDAIEEKSE